MNHTRTLKKPKNGKRQILNRLVGYLFSLAVLLCLSPAYAESNDSSCLDMTLDESEIWDRDHTTNYIIEVLHENYRTFGQINWNCIAKKFEGLSPKTSVRRFEGPTVGDRIIYQFTVDRTSNLFVALFFIGPGKSKGKFTAFINIFPSGEVAAIRKGGKEEWLTFE